MTSGGVPAGVEKSEIICRNILKRLMEMKIIGCGVHQERATSEVSWPHHQVCEGC